MAHSTRGLPSREHCDDRLTPPRRSWTEPWTDRPQWTVGRFGRASSRQRPRPPRLARLALQNAPVMRMWRVCCTAPAHRPVTAAGTRCRSRVGDRGKGGNVARTFLCRTDRPYSSAGGRFGRSGIGSVGAADTWKESGECRPSFRLRPDLPAGHVEALRRVAVPAGLVPAAVDHARRASMPRS